MTKMIFVDLPVTDARAMTGALIALSIDDRAAVDAFVEATLAGTAPFA